MTDSSPNKTSQIYLKAWCFPQAPPEPPSHCCILTPFLVKLRFPSNLDIAPWSWVSRQALDRILDPTGLTWRPWFLFSTSLPSKCITLCCSYFLIPLSHLLHCKILKDKEYVLFIFVFLTVLAWCLAREGVSINGGWKIVPLHMCQSVLCRLPMSSSPSSTLKPLQL